MNECEYESDPSRYQFLSRMPPLRLILEIALLFTRQGEHGLELHAPRLLLRRQRQGLSERGDRLGDREPGEVGCVLEQHTPERARKYTERK